MIEIIKRLKEKGIKITPQRITIIEYLSSTRSHPSADEIYNVVLKKYPHISFATVYNTLMTLENLGEIIEIGVDPLKKRYDMDTSFHHHFFCYKCRQVYDLSEYFFIKPLEEIEGHRIERALLNFVGKCNSCINKEEEDEQNRKKS